MFTISFVAVLLLTITKITASTITDPIPFGNERLNDFFFVKNGTIFHQFNHGAYGGTPKIVVASQYTYVEQMESSIDAWMNRATGYRQCITSAKQRLSTMMNIKNASDTVLVDNASEGINVIIRNLDPPLGPSDYILDLSIAYGPFKGLYQWLGSRYGVKVLEVPIQWPVTGPASFIDPITAALKANASTIKIRAAIFSHVSAYPAVILPVKELVELFHQYNIPVIVDGAHALGNIEINVEDMSDVDYYFTNTHKWLYSSKSSAILYVRRDHQHLYVPAPAVVDSAMTEDFETRFIWTGTRDRTAYCAILSALDYRQSLGGEERIMKYNHDLAQYGGQYLSRLWETKILSPENLQSSMTNVQVPTNNLTICQMVVGQLYNTYNTMVSGASSIAPELGDIPCYLRLSAQIYQEQNDWHVLGALVLKLLKEFNSYMPEKKPSRF
ncbi:unnamed protein product [Rotaria socialis]|uniref:Aminotransferase class V domain-containing protein n=1 Tax=Rotaria socialis TaxID=392032 RepID=A0A820DWK6_9BILA|nr:unnamed protein product [Rotaria socialis]CAF3276246.1 unnamed protein product [Rotaria socialis]CAF3409803.1 unnamed protein product [Rotaria socialis]CAF3447412.1 unnamed protein product [Rotaria socialis]CAF3476983.1 unnamed protein product [Rotaria socialis]